MQIVIEIPEEEYEEIIYSEDCGLHRLTRAIANGTPLPEGHGRIGDIDELHNTFKKACDAYNIDDLSFISDVDMHFDLAPTIIEANKESEDKE